MAKREWQTERGDEREKNRKKKRERDREREIAKKIYRYFRDKSNGLLPPPSINL